MALLRSHMWTAPDPQDLSRQFHLIACVHMSGLSWRSHMNAGQDGIRNTGAKHQDGLEGPMGSSQYSVSRIDRSHHLLLSCKLWYRKHVAKIRTAWLLASPSSCSESRYGRS